METVHFTVLTEPNDISFLKNLNIIFDALYWKSRALAYKQFISRFNIIFDTLYWENAFLSI